MGIKSSLRKVVERLTGTHILREIPFGVNIANDLSQKFPNYQPNLIFDVGANVGQSALSYMSSFPASTVYCFEPVKETYEELLRITSGHSQVSCYNFALSDSIGKGTMLSEGRSTMNCLLNDKNRKADQALETESVDVSTLDAFCKAHNVNQISYLKIDTEGGDLNVLVGSQNLLKLNGIDFVEVEAGMNPDNKHHVPFETLKGFLEGHGYCVFGIYEQVPEWAKKQPHLRRTNTVFVSGSLISDYSSKYRS